MTTNINTQLEHVGKWCRIQEVLLHTICCHFVSSQSKYRTLSWHSLCTTL